ncbi:hypothetical protein F5880DRAFT_1458434, partial [Lentinula raphanica]
PQVTPLVIGIRREDPSRVWERRVPLTPVDVKALPFPIHVHIQPSDKRVFRDREYEDGSGAEIKITEDLGEAHVVLGIKEVPVGELDVLEGKGVRMPGIPRTYMMFSHTAKGQEYNMPLLDRFL